jgi:ABC-type Fe3+/spermidine/putrescine transport system ATPase subunit
MLRIENLSAKIDSFWLRDISFSVVRGDYMVLLGRSGAGKTQLLELIAGLVTPVSGSVILDGRNITTLPVQRRGTGLLFQDFALFSHMTVYDNIGYALKIARRDAREIESEVKAISEKMNIMSLLERKVDTLSGGEKQRTALARTLITNPSLLLLDEPLASVDASLKDDIMRLLRTINREGRTIIHVTHDYTEAISLASRVGVLHNGRMVQSGTPDEVFNRPANRFVARYTGIKNFFSVRFVRENGDWQAVTRSGTGLRVPDAGYPGEGLLLVRSRQVYLSILPPESEECNVMRGVVIDIITIPFGREVEVSAGEIIYATVPDDDPIIGELLPGSEVYVRINPSDLIFLDGSRDQSADL